MCLELIPIRIQQNYADPIRIRIRIHNTGIKYGKKSRVCLMLGTSDILYIVQKEHTSTKTKQKKYKCDLCT